MSDVPCPIFGRPASVLLPLVFLSISIIERHAQSLAVLLHGSIDVRVPSGRWLVSPTCRCALVLLLPRCRLQLPALGLCRHKPLHPHCLIVVSLWGFCLGPLLALPLSRPMPLTRWVLLSLFCLAIAALPSGNSSSCLLVSQSPVHKAGINMQEEVDASMAGAWGDDCGLNPRRMVAMRIKEIACITWLEPTKVIDQRLCRRNIKTPSRTPIKSYQQGGDFSYGSLCRPQEWYITFCCCGGFWIHLSIFLWIETLYKDKDYGKYILIFERDTLLRGCVIVLICL